MKWSRKRGRITGSARNSANFGSFATVGGGVNNTASGPLGTPDVANDVLLGDPTTVVLLNTVVGVVLI